MVICTGQGDAGGDHCCYIYGEVCELLDTSGPIPRCSVWDRMNEPVWTESPVGRLFAERYPGYDCKDWPQNIPEVMAKGRGLCCWNGRSEMAGA